MPGCYAVSVLGIYNLRPDSCHFIFRQAILPKKALLFLKPVAGSSHSRTFGSETTLSFSIKYLSR